jgi:hypothetical protein
MTTASRLGIVLLSVLILPVAASAAISGKVLNMTSARPAAGDDVILLRLGNGMEEESRTKTDLQGAFTLNENSPDAQYVVRVIHQGVNYDRSVTVTTPLAIQVFDSVRRIQGLSGNMGIAQMESDGKILKVTEMYAINNTSTPPVTQFSPRNFEIFLPEKAVLDSVEAKREQGVWIKTPAAPVKGQSGHYAIGFPLRPGDTLIKFIYHLPYAKATRFHLKLSYPIKKFAVVHPPSMTFRASHPGTFTSPGQANGLQLEAAVKEPLLDVPPFEISGVGVAPPPASAAVPIQPPVASPAPADASLRDPAVQQAAGSDATTPAGPTRDSGIVLLATAGLLTLGALVFLRRRRTPLVATAGASTPARARPAQSAVAGARPLLDALKEELFQLELDRANGTISADDFAVARKALDQTLKRAMGSGKR